MLLIALLYGLLAMRVSVHACAGLCGAQGSVRAELRLAGLILRFDGVIIPKEEGASLRLMPRYGRTKRPKPPARTRLRRLRRAGPYLLAALHAGRFEQISLHMRLGLEEAWSTAVAAGTVKAGVSALLSALQTDAPCDLRVDSDFRAPCFLMTARCIFSACPGDIMFAVLKAAVKKTGKEGFGWKSIPLKA